MKNEGLGKNDEIINNDRLEMKNKKQRRLINEK